MFALFLFISSISEVGQKARKINRRGKKPTKQTNQHKLITLSRSPGEAIVAESYLLRTEGFCSGLVQFE